MADLASALSNEHRIPVLDGVACAVKLCEALVQLGLKTSKTGGYAPPRPKRYSGIFARSEEHTSELQSLMRISYAVFCLKKKNTINYVYKQCRVTLELRN